MSKLAQANLYYGSRPYLVTPSETTPLPTEFDFSDPEGCARKVAAVMSNASGGHTVRDVHVHYHMGRQTATVIGDGVAVHYMPVQRPKLTVEEALRVHAERISVRLGNVRTDQYGEGWKRAVWS